MDGAARRFARVPKAAPSLGEVCAEVCLRFIILCPHLFCSITFSILHSAGVAQLEEALVLETRG
ncbi:MAG: hypothetical protein QOD00_1571 [Blastocatellia bacterium]|nr:hypothetical protein [Blastocatellia bacterium]